MNIKVFGSGQEICFPSFIRLIHGTKTQLADNTPETVDTLPSPAGQANVINILDGRIRIRFSNTGNDRGKV